MTYAVIVMLFLEIKFKGYLQANSGCDTIE
ncbi:hypothetical protein SAMN04490355_102019 [Pelosinus propionicus DSM 13327]|uniref:Uncharacterized protein n=1 Tax=Pelosinus propionicus DSM 13327 TaxID=1123291 RepID=A0A1I4KWQ8_9FIRM|nr:hypothetical protein SAMN04490355_102019 [Pelosinus propionicus DSM 13327]